MRSAAKVRTRAVLAVAASALLFAGGAGGSLASPRTQKQNSEAGKGAGGRRGQGNERAGGGSSAGSGKSTGRRRIRRKLPVSALLRKIGGRRRVGPARLGIERRLSREQTDRRMISPARGTLSKSFLTDKRAQRARTLNRIEIELARAEPIEYGHVAASDDGVILIGFDSGDQGILRHYPGTASGELVSYNLSKLFEFDLVPPTIPYSIEIDGSERVGSLQLFVEGVEGARIGIEDQGYWHSGTHLEREAWDSEFLPHNTRDTVRAFYFLVGASDAHGFNWRLVNRGGKGHGHPVVLFDLVAMGGGEHLFDGIERIGRRQYQKLKTASHSQLEEALRPLDRLATWPSDSVSNWKRGLIARRGQLVDRIDELIAERGEQAVLFDD